MKHYAIRHKARIFQFFDSGKRPADIADTSVSRSTLYQYYAEWRREKGIAGRLTGFAVRPFTRQTKNGQAALTSVSLPLDKPPVTAQPVMAANAAEKTALQRFAEDCDSIIEALKKTNQRFVRLRGSRQERFLADVLQLKEQDSGKIVFLSTDQYQALFRQWRGIATSTENIAGFYQLSQRAGINYIAPGLD